MNKDLKVQTDSSKGQIQAAGFNNRMCILSVIGICFVILGHLRSEDMGTGTFFDWFPYYSFHMPLFLFITGYFFRDVFQGTPGDSAKQLLLFVWKKFRRLIIPYYVINGIFILLQMLLSGSGFVFYPYTFLEFLLMPWNRCQPYTFAIPTWYLAGLFLAEVFYVLIRMPVMFLLRKKTAAEVLLLVLTLLLGAAACYVNARRQPPESIVVLLRSVVMLFFIQTGRLYRVSLERYDTLPSRWYFPILLVCQFILLLLSKGARLTFGLYSLQNFGTTGFLYFCAGITGILLWLRLSRILDRVAGSSKLIRFIGQNTKYIMSFHLFGFFLLNLLFLLLHNQKIGTVFLGAFDPGSFYTDPVYYWYQEGGPRFMVLYFLAGMGFSLLIAKLIQIVRHAVSVRRS